MTERVYPLKEAAALLGGLSRGTLYNLEARGELRMIRIGGRAFIPASEIRRLTQESEIPDRESPSIPVLPHSRSGTIPGLAEAGYPSPLPATRTH